MKFIQPKPFEFHPIAECFPLLVGDAFEELKEDIRIHGQQTKIVIFEEMILDGRNRYRACQELGISERWIVFTGTFEEAMHMVISLNLRRRHLDRDEIRIAAGKLATLEHGTNRYCEKVESTCVLSTGALDQKEVAEKLGLSEGEVKKAVTIERKATPEVKNAYQEKKITQGQAFEFAQHEPEKQRELVDKKATIREAKAMRKNMSEAMRELDGSIEKIRLFVSAMHIAKTKIENVDEWNAKIDKLATTINALRI